VVARRLVATTVGTVVRVGTMTHTRALVLLLVALLTLAAGATYRRTDWMSSWSYHGDDVRAVVLQRDKEGDVWVCPYTGKVFTDPRGLDVDHVLPLGLMQRDGGAAWPKDKKQAYAHALGDPQHLLAVDASANRAKGDKGPSAWRPPVHEAWCEYALAFSRIATTWHAHLSHADAQAIVEMVATCPVQPFDLTH
jgi:hypothetical protein